MPTGQRWCEMVGLWSTTGFTYRVFAGRQNLLNHHAVPRERAPVQRVGPIGTEGTQAWCG